MSAEVSGDTAIMKFNWELAEDDVGFVIMMALPHHLDTLVNLDTDETNHKLMTLKGRHTRHKLIIKVLIPKNTLKNNSKK